MTRPRRCITLLLMFAGIILAAAQVPTIGAPTLELTTRSKVAAEALKKTWELKQRGDALPPGNPFKLSWGMIAAAFLREN